MPGWSRGGKKKGTMTGHHNCAAFIRERGSYAFTGGKKRRLIGDNFAAHLLTLSLYLLPPSRLRSIGASFFRPATKHLFLYAIVIYLLPCFSFRARERVHEQWPTANNSSPVFSARNFAPRDPPMKIASRWSLSRERFAAFCGRAIRREPSGSHYQCGTRDIAKEKRDPVCNASRFDVTSRHTSREIIKYRETREHPRAASQSEGLIYNLLAW